ncbi:MAG: AMP-binding protein, partial [Chloroflexota bacterium]
DKVAYRFLEDGEQQEINLTYQALDEQARMIAATLQNRSEPGDRVLLLYNSSLDYIAAFFGCLYAGLIAVPTYLPHPKRPMPRLKGIVQNAQPALCLTRKDIWQKLSPRFAEEPSLASLPAITTDTLDISQADLWQNRAILPETPAFLQYTSGSTSQPKGVIVNQANLIHNQTLIEAAFGHNEDTIVAGWLPLFHDMGLVGNILQPLYLGVSCVLLSPTAFLQKPVRWLQAISRYKATTSGGPNFAFELCAQKVTDDQKDSLDLSSWQVAFNGAEPIRADTLDRFAQAFAACGFRREALYPCYGLAEASLFVSGGVHTEPPRTLSVDKAALAHHQIVEETGPDAQVLVSSGQSWLDQQITIVDLETLAPRQAGQVGEIWLSGPSVAQGYWQQSDETEQAFQAHLADTGPWLRTGDLGFLRGDDLFVTGRVKDLIIIRGQNHYPQDIELTIEQSHSALQPVAGAVFTLETETTEQLVAVQEVKRTHLRKLDASSIYKAIRQAVFDMHGVQVHTIVLLKPTTIYKTSSGKIQRHKCRAEFIAGNLQTVASDQKNGTGESPMNQPQHASSQQSQQRADHLIEWLRNYATTRINSRIIDERRTIPPHVVLDFGYNGLMGMQIPESYGGLALTHHDAARVFEQLAAIDSTLTLFVGLNQVLGTRPILKYASQEKKQELLPIIAQGRQLAAFALTEPEAGSNPRAIATTATPDQGGWRLNGEKIWIGTAAWAGTINVFAQTLDENQQPVGITAFMVPQNAEGLTQGPEALTMGMRGMIQNRLYLNDVWVGPENLLGQVGQGMEIAQDAMMTGRLLVGTTSVGMMKRCAQLMHRYSARRTISTGRLLDNPVTLTWLSDLTAAITTLEVFMTKVTQQLDEGQPVPVEAYAICKTSGAELLWQAIDQLPASANCCMPAIVLTRSKGVDDSMGQPAVRRPTIPSP